MNEYIPLVMLFSFSAFMLTLGILAYRGIDRQDAEKRRRQEAHNSRTV